MCNFVRINITNLCIRRGVHVKVPYMEGHEEIFYEFIYISSCAAKFERGKSKVFVRKLRYGNDEKF